MKNTAVWLVLLVPLLIVFSGCGTAEREPAAEKTVPDLKGLQLTVCYPSTGSLAALANLKDRGLFNPDEWHVKGIYHRDERTNYQRSRDIIQEQGWDWITLEEINGELSQDNLFKDNPVTSKLRRIFEESDGIIFFGGADIPPYIYGEKTHLLTSIRTPFRHFFELSFVFHLLGGSQNPEHEPWMKESPELPVLGICLGEQTLNVGTGGTMLQDIWSEVYGLSFLEDITEMDPQNWHQNPWDDLYPQHQLFPYNLHSIKLNPEGLFVSQWGFSPDETPLILSSHHQAVEKLGKGMAAAAVTLDGKVIEAIHHTEFPHVLGIQFHPEFPLLWDESRSFRMTPQDETEFIPLQKLKDNPPSHAFHKKIWSWMEEKAEVHYLSRQKKGEKS